MANVRLERSFSVIQFSLKFTAKHLFAGAANIK